jgi:hypothetical protein
MIWSQVRLSSPGRTALGSEEAPCMLFCMPIMALHASGDIGAFGMVAS